MTPTVYRFKLGIYIPQHVCGIVFLFLQVSAVSVSATASVEPSDFRRAVSSPNLHCTISAPSSLPDEHTPLVTGSDVCLVSFVCCMYACVCVCEGGRCECACGKKGCGKFELSICAHLSMFTALC